MYDAISRSEEDAAAAKTAGREPDTGTLKGESVKKILMRSAMPFGEERSISEILVENLIGNNTGNLIFQSSLARAVLTEDTEITTIRTDRIYSEEEVERWNAEYDMFLIPLANAFRTTFRTELRMLTDLVKRLTIPCVVVGVGLARSLKSNRWTFLHDEESTAFVRAVLEKSSIIGVRGEITAEYLRQKGFVPEKDFTVIGCPSLYMYGDALPAPKQTELTPRSRVTMNFKAGLPEHLYTFLREQGERFDHSVFITQVIEEIRMLYVGDPYITDDNRDKIPADYPMHFTSPMMRDDRIVGVLDMESWITFLKEQDFNFGSRIHGNIAAVLAGVPCWIFAGDCRVKELADYHHIPCITANDLTEDMDVFSQYEKTDYSQVLAGHGERLTHYLDFLDANKVPRISREALGGRDTPYDRMQKAHAGHGLIHSFALQDTKEQERRLSEYFSSLRRERQELMKTVEERQKQLSALEKKGAAQAKEIANIRNSKLYKIKSRYDSFMKR